MSLPPQLEDPPVAYPDVPSFIASLQAHHDEILEDVDITTSEGQSTQVGHLGFAECMCRVAARLKDVGEG